MSGGLWLRSMHRLRAALGRKRVEREMEDEIRFHLDARAAELVRSGVPEAEARRQARLEFGGVETHKHGMRAASGLPWLEGVWTDLRYGARVLRKSPGFTAIAVCSLALAIGANTTIFSTANRLIYAKLGVPRPGELRLFTLEGPTPLAAHSTWGNNTIEHGWEHLDMFPYPVFKQMQMHARTLEPVGFKDTYGLNVTANGLAQEASGELVSGNFYGAMRLKPQLGRGIVPADDAVQDAGAVAVIGDGFWHRAFGGAPDVLGRVLTVNGNLVTVVGVNLREYTGAGGSPRGTDLVMPLSMVNQVSPTFGTELNLLSRPEVWWVNLLARKRVGVPEQQAAAEMNALFGAAVRGAGIRDLKSSDHIPKVLLEDGSRGLNMAGSSLGKPMNVLLGMTVLVLLLACANLANLMLARAGARERETQVRLALGASRARVMRQVLTESLMLAGMGGALGFALAFVVRDRVLLLLIPGSQRLAEAQHAPFDWRVFGFGSGVTIATGLLFGLLPAWRASRGELRGGLKESGRTATRQRRNWSGRGLVASQVMLATLLVAGAALFVRTLVNLYRIDPGFRTQGLLQFDVSLPKQRYPEEKAGAVMERMKQALAAVPGVQAMTLSSVALLAGSQNATTLNPQGTPTGKERGAWFSDVDDRFFFVMGIAMRRGRGFGPEDTPQSPGVIVINETLARQTFPNRDPLGQRLTFNLNANPVKWLTVIGVCADTAYSDLTQATLPLFFDLYRQTPSFSGGTYTIRSTLPPKTLLPGLRRAVQSVDRDVPLRNIRTMDEQIAQDLQQQRLFAVLTAAFGLLALVLAVVGVYGVMAYTVAQRTQEIGIRLALGSPRGAVRWMVLRESLLLSVAGVGAGLWVALALGRLVESLLYGLKPRDPLSLAASGTILLMVALLAGWLPAVRASRVDPMQALRHE